MEGKVNQNQELVRRNLKERRLSFTTALPDAVETARRAGRQQEASQRLESIRGWVAEAPTQVR